MRDVVDSGSGVSVGAVVTLVVDGTEEGIAVVTFGVIVALVVSSGGTPVVMPMAGVEVTVGIVELVVSGVVDGAKQLLVCSVKLVKISGF